MAACKSMQHIFDNSIQNNPSSLIKPIPSFAELFGDLHYRENSKPVSSSSSSSMNSESLQLCTEGLGFESFDNVESLKNEFDINNEDGSEGSSNNKKYDMTQKMYVKRHSNYYHRKGRFPPPISSISKTGKPWVSYQSYREDGRFILKETMIPSQDVLYACREDGRLRLNFVQSCEQDDEEIIEEDDEEEGELGDIGRNDEYEEAEGQDGGLEKEGVLEEAEIRDGNERGCS